LRINFTNYLGTKSKEEGNNEIKDKPGTTLCWNSPSPNSGGSTLLTYTFLYQQTPALLTKKMINNERTK
jgi:hypothetical protein